MPEPVGNGKAHKLQHEVKLVCHCLTEDISMPTLVDAEFSMPSGRRVEEDSTFGRRVTEDLSMPIEQVEFSMTSCHRHLGEDLSMPIEQLGFSMPEPAVNGNARKLQQRVKKGRRRLAEDFSMLIGQLEFLCQSPLVMERLVSSNMRSSWFAIVSPKICL